MRLFYNIVDITIIFFNNLLKKKPKRYDFIEFEKRVTKIASKYDLTYTVVYFNISRCAEHTIKSRFDFYISCTDNLWNIANPITASNSDPERALFEFEQKCIERKNPQPIEFPEQILV